eukprot:gb/GECG01004857.1/.p1 GENE.gb/GECG01004857.1/~~gb/GECG01004857.1/.p1  ORF type:complete len:106 (+),score=4.38 gb/GECG01004857.1/:1-318(+)
MEPLKDQVGIGIATTGITSSSRTRTNRILRTSSGLQELVISEFSLLGTPQCYHTVIWLIKGMRNASLSYEVFEFYHGLASGELLCMDQASAPECCSCIMYRFLPS